MQNVRPNPRRVVFAEGEEEKLVRAAVGYRSAGYGGPVLIGREDLAKASMASLGPGIVKGTEIHSARPSGANSKMRQSCAAACINGSGDEDNHPGQRPANVLDDNTDPPVARVTQPIAHGLLIIKDSYVPRQNYPKAHKIYNPGELGRAQ
jgi:hypothetical protein